jgi:hypothetical protein
MTDDDPQLESTLDRMIRDGAVSLGHPILEEFKRGYFTAIIAIASRSTPCRYS